MSPKAVKVLLVPMSGEDSKDGGDTRSAELGQALGALESLAAHDDESGGRKGAQTGCL